MFLSLYLYKKLAFSTNYLVVCTIVQRVVFHNNSGEFNYKFIKKSATLIARNLIKI